MNNNDYFNNGTDKGLKNTSYEDKLPEIQINNSKTEKQSAYLSENNKNAKVMHEIKKKSKIKWFVLLGCAVTLIFTILVYILIPMTTQSEPIKRAEVLEDKPMTIEETIPQASEKPSPKPSTNQTNQNQNETKEVLSALSELYKQNKNLAGWLEIPGTVISYPVMYTPWDGEYYLYRTFDNQEDPTKEGCLFIDENCNIEPRSTNLLIHGHNMKNGTMFHSLLEYEDENYYKEHPTILYSSLWAEDEYEIISVFRSKIYNTDDNVFKYYKFYNAKNEREFNEFIDNIKKLELYDIGATAEYGDELITLSTCEYTQDNGRFIVVARKKE